MLASYVRLVSALPSDTGQSGTTPAPPKGARGGGRRIGDVWQWLGTSGGESGTSGTGWRTFLYTVALVAVIAGLFNTLSIITITHEEPQVGVLAPIVWEGSSWVTLVAVLWIPWLAFRFAPPLGRKWWRLAVHPPAAFLVSLIHVTSFIALRKLAYAFAGDVYDVGPFWPHFFYEFSKDGLGYLLIITSFAVIERILESQRPAVPAGEAMYTIRDGARITRVPVRDILAISSAGNYVEFVLRDGRKLLMRSPLSAIEAELAPQGFVRVHRGWLVNAMQMTGLKPEGSGDYTVELGALMVPLSRRFPDALAKLRAG